MLYPTTFLGQPSRFSASLNKFDPLANEPLLRLIDPLPKNHQPNQRLGRIPWLRLVVAWCIVVLPLFALALAPNKTLGGTFFGEPGTSRLGMNRDIAFWMALIVGSVWLLLVIWGRRVMGDLILHLEKSGVVTGFDNFHPSRRKSRSLLGSLEWISRLTIRRLPLWIPVLLVMRLFWIFHLLDAPSTNDYFRCWATTSSTPSTFFHFLSWTHEQPNVLGLYSCLASAIWGYLILIAVRLVIVFACLSDSLARHKSLRILPTHPDGTGGLLAVGQTALIYSLYTLMAGISLSTNSLTYYGLLHAKHAGLMFFFVWTLYIVLAPVLFLLPLLPLHKAMMREKQSYLDKGMELYSKIEQQHRDDLDKGTFNPEALQGQTALECLMETASKMSVWPFDKSAVGKYAGILLSPLLPILVNRLSPEFRQFLHGLYPGS